MYIFFGPSKILYIFCWRVVTKETTKVDYVQLKGWLGKSKSALRPIEMPYVYAQKLTLFKYRFILLLVEKALNFNESRKTHQKNVRQDSRVTDSCGYLPWRFNPIVLLTPGKYNRPTIAPSITSYHAWVPNWTHVFGI